MVGCDLGLTGTRGVKSYSRRQADAGVWGDELIPYGRSLQLLPSRVFIPGYWLPRAGGSNGHARVSVGLRDPAVEGHDSTIPSTYHLLQIPPPLEVAEEVRR